MKILLTGGGSGGHFYPIIAVAEALREIAKEERLFNLELYFMSDRAYSRQILFEQDIIFKKVSAGKRRLYFSPRNIIDLFKTAIGVLKAIFEMYKICPDVVFGKGGYASFPALFAAKTLKVPVLIHESDSTPGRVNIWAAEFARGIAVSFPAAADYFPKEKVVYTGNPIRKAIQAVSPEGAYELLNLEKYVPVVFILGGSLGAEIINDVIIDALPELVKKYQVIHQTGIANFKIVSDTAILNLMDHSNKNRYHPFEYLNDLKLKAAAGVADVIISRAGSTIFEIALWGKPSIIIPITESHDDHQRRNAFNYARSGAATVIEENNLAANVLLSEIDRIINNSVEREKMAAAAKNFAHANAAEKIAKELIAIALEHET